jgi:hypothetical protein
MSLYDPLGFLKGEAVYSYPTGVLQAGSGVIYPQVKQKLLALRRGYFAALLFAVTIAFFVFSLSAFLFSLPSKSSASYAPLVLSAVPSLVSGTGARTEEMHIANDGLVLLRSARVVSVNGTTLTLGMSWGATAFTWEVRTAASSYGSHEYGTRFMDQSGNKITLDDIQIGGLVTITGMFDDTAKVPTVDADTVRSLQ